MRFIVFMCSSNTGATEEGRKEAAGFRGRDSSSEALEVSLEPRNWAEDTQTCLK